VGALYRARGVLLPSLNGGKRAHRKVPGIGGTLGNFPLTGGVRGKNWGILYCYLLGERENIPTNIKEVVYIRRGDYTTAWEEKWAHNTGGCIIAIKESVRMNTQHREKV